MSDALEEARSSLGPHVADRETLHAASIKESEREDETIVIAVTDRRVIEFEQDTGGMTDQTEIETYLLSDDRITGVSYSRTAQTLDIGEWIGGGLVVIGALFGFLGAYPIGEITVPLLVFGGLVMAAGVVLAVLADQSNSGVTVEVESTAGSKSWSLPDGDAEVAQAISRVVAEQHG